MHILVTGATGFVGRHLVAALLRRGDRVRALGRNADACAALAANGAEVVRADLRDRDAVIAACTGVEAVCHVGAMSEPWGRAATSMPSTSAARNTSSPAALRITSDEWFTSRRRASSSTGPTTAT